MNKNIRYKRGTVWYYVDENYIMKSKNNAKDNITHGSRPVLIYSSDECNASCPNVIVLKISTKIHDSLRSHICIEGPEGPRDIDCSSIMQIPKTNLIEYMYTVCDEDMLRVDRGAMFAIGINTHSNSIDTSLTMEQFKSIIEGMVSQKAAELNKDKSLVTIQYIKDLVDKLSNSTTCDVSTTSEVSDTDSNLVSKPTKKIHMHKRRVWTLDIAKSYIKDYHELTLEDMKSKYNLNSVYDVSKYMNYLKKKFRDKLEEEVSV